ncbi:MAG: hypothetical protein AB2719_16755 [Candidatus Thiodiazotropha sp.]
MKKSFDKISRMVLALVTVSFGLVRNLLAAFSDTDEPNDRQLHDASIIGEYNHRTGRLDAGNDPYGWYDDD